MSTWRGNLAAGIEDDDTSPDRPMPTLVSLHFIRTALRRRLWVCVVAAVLGLVAAGTFLVAFPLPHQARATLVLTYDPEVDPSRAMATNVSLLQTRTVAAQVIDELDLTMLPEDFLKSFIVEAESSELMTLTLSAPTDAEAVRQLQGLTAIYLDFRAEQLSLQSENFTNGLQERIRRLQTDVEGAHPADRAAQGRRVRGHSDQAERPGRATDQPQRPDRGPAAVRWRTPRCATALWWHPAECSIRPPPCRVWRSARSCWSWPRG